MSKFLSIICATYNSEKTLQKLLRSLRKQTCKDFELIIIDGVSTDGTLEILRQNRDIITELISEKDRGIYDAWNKGVKMANYEWLSFVGADDALKDDYVAIYKNAIEKLRDQKIDYITSRVNYINSRGRLLKVLGKEWIWGEFKLSMTVAHVGSLHSKSLFQEFGYFDTSYKIIGDYELLLRKKSNLRTAFVDDVTVNMQAGGRSLSFQALIERYRAHRQTAGLSSFTSCILLLFGIAALIRFKIIHKL